MNFISKLTEEYKKDLRSKYEMQSKQIENIFGEVDDFYHNLKVLGAYLAGGAVTSIFTNKEVNDLDIYFRSLNDIKAFIACCFGELDDESSYWKVEYEELVDFESTDLQCCGYTKKSIMLRTRSGQEVQLIHCDFYETPEDIFNTFDFCMNMGVYDFKEQMFVLHDNFLVDNSCRKLTVNTGTAFPIISQLRIDKYKQRGYSINRKEFIKLSLAVSELSLKSWDDVKNAVGGMYGYTLEELFDENKEFSYEELYNQIENLGIKLDQNKPMAVVDDATTLFEVLDDLHCEPQEEYYYYKKVCKTGDDNIFTSHYTPSFKYEVGETVQCDNGVYLYKSLDRANNHYSGDTVIKLKSVGKRATLVPGCSGGKYKTTDDLIVCGVENKGGNTSPMIPQPPSLPIR